MEGIFWKLVFASIMIVVSWKLMLESIWESFQDDINMRRAKKELPVLAREMKLKHKRGDEFGIYYGSWNNHKIRIEPNHFQAAICITSQVDPQFSAVHTGISKKVFHVNTLFHYLKNIIIKFIPEYPIVESEPHGFNFDNAALDRYFEKRLLLGDSGKEMIHDQALQNAILIFLDKNKSIVKDLIIGPEVCCSLWLGSSIKPRLHSVTGRQVRQMLPELLLVVQALERAGKK